MRKLLSGAAAAIALIALAVPAAADMTRGTVKMIDSGRHMIQLKTGQWFELGTGIRSVDLRPGDQVEIEHHTFQKGFPLAQRIIRIDEHNRVVLPKN